MNPIANSVGVNGINHPADVRLIQMLLNNWLRKTQKPPLQVDGIVGSKTIKEISNFQRSRGGQVDGRVDPNGPTIKDLISFQIKLLYEGVSDQFLEMAKGGTVQGRQSVSPTPNAGIEAILNEYFKAAKKA